MSTPTYHHLGPNGWHEGSDRPDGTIVTYERELGPGPIEDKPLIVYDIVWRDTGASADDIKKLRELWPREELDGTYADVAWEVAT